MRISGENYHIMSTKSKDFLQKNRPYTKESSLYKRTVPVQKNRPCTKEPSLYKRTVPVQKNRP